MERGTIVRLSRPDPDNLARQFANTEYPIYGVIASTGEYCRCVMFCRNIPNPRGMYFDVYWNVPIDCLEVVEEP